jgi:catechol 2,3-dioxygenase-like lactoylglutathione lyase family enzyme
MSTGIRFQRGNIVVADLDRSLEVYRDILGLTVEFTKESEPTSYSYPVFEIPRQAKLRFATLNAGPEQRRVLALTEITGVALGKPPLPRPAALVFEVPDMDPVLAALGARDDVHVYEEETLHTQDGRVGREIGFVDPDGHLIVLYNISSAPS